MITNALTIDVEDYFQVSAMAPYIRRDEWDTRECRVERNVDRILAMLEQHGTRATFFTLGWIAERYPQLVRRIVAGGHELASHGYGHERVSDLSREAFLQDITRAKGVLEDLGGVVVQGYRAPSFSIGTGNLWALDLLAQTGHRYSSSIYPIKHDHYGMPDSPRFAYMLASGLLEVPVTTVFGGLLGKAGEPVYHRVARNGTHAGAALARLGIVERIALTPEGIPADRACKAIDIAVELRVPVLNFSFHSPSLQPGNTPYVRSPADLDLFYRWWDVVLDHLARRGVEATTAADIMAMAARKAPG